MNIQIAIDFEPRTLARRHDPETSKEAAAKVREFASGQCVDILELLRKYGPMSAEQIAARLCIDKVAVCRRLPDLEKASLARPNGMTVPTVSGRRQRVWEGCNG